MRSGRAENKTPPVTDLVLQPLLAAALYLVTTHGPHAVKLAAQLRGELDRVRPVRGHQIERRGQQRLQDQVRDGRGLVPLARCASERRLTPRHLPRDAGSGRAGRW